MFFNDHSMNEIKPEDEVLSNAKEVFDFSKY